MSNVYRVEMGSGVAELDKVPVRLRVFYIKADSAADAAVRAEVQSEATGKTDREVRSLRLLGELIE